MRKLFIPLARMIQWIGALLRCLARYLWTFKYENPKDILHNSTNEKKNKWINGILGVVPIGVSILGFVINPTSSDFKNLESAMNHSFERMEQLSYMTKAVGYQDSLTKNVQLRGEAVLLSSLVRTQIESEEYVNFNSLMDCERVVENGEIMSGALYEIMDRFDYFLDEYLKYASSNIDDRHEVVTQYYLRMLDTKFNEYKGAMFVMKKKKDELISEIKKVKRNPKNKDVLARKYHELIYNNDIFRFETKMYECIDIIYEYLVVIELVDIYSDYTYARDSIHNY